MEIKEIKLKIEEVYGEFVETSKTYIEKSEIYETLKVQKIDPSIRDSIEKQLTRAAIDDPEFQSLEIEVNSLRRKRDDLFKEFNILKELSKISLALLAK